MAKNKSIVDEIAELKPRRVGAGPWWERFQKKDPKAAKLANDAIVDWLANGSTRSVFPTAHSLHLYLLGRDPDNRRPPAIPTTVGYHSFCRYIRTLRGSR